MLLCLKGVGVKGSLRYFFDGQKAFSCSFGLVPNFSFLPLLDQHFSFTFFCLTKKR